VLFAQSRAALQAISVIRDKAGSDAMIFVPYVASAKSVIGGLGEDKLKGLLSTDAAKDAADPVWADDPSVKAYLAFLEKYTPASDLASDASSPGGYLAAQMMVEVLKRCGDTLTRAEVIKQASNLKNVSFPLNLPGIAFNTSPDNLFPLRITQIKRHNGTHWELIGKPITE
jgi:branched-chain amino acid transport system substrate-binding protein